MALAALALQSQMVPHLIGIGSRLPASNLAELITAPKSAFAISWDTATKAVELDFRDANPLVSALAADSGRFSCAAFQTASHLTPIMAERDASAWSFVKLYYAAFYSAHAMLRLLGEACSFLYREQINRLNKLIVVQANPPPIQLETGLYHCCLSTDSRLVNCRRAASKSGGTHEAFWELFGSKMRSVANSVLSGRLSSIDSQLVFSKITVLLDVLGRKAGYSWLSHMRNDIQYRLQYGVWYPEQLRHQSRKALVRIAEQWRLDPLSIEITRHSLGTLGEFVAASTFLVSLCKDLLTHIAERSAEGKNSFVRTGPLAFVHDSAAR